ncbi:hypothetical protein [Longimicrobium sp.]|uniref:hypothetical protein n=1 Tax=Longimicrobium sp. TaxID=2029185 RepID=UPI003B3A1CD1
MSASNSALVLLVMRAAGVSDEIGNHAVVPRKRGFISLGYNHRLVNGADGNRFRARVKQVVDTSR